MEQLHHFVFLLGAMTIVETIDQYQGFKIITDRIKTLNKVKLLWIGGQVITVNIIIMLILPGMVTMIIPLTIL